MRIASTFLWALAALTPAIQAAVLAIDYGAEFTKLSLVKPGVPFDVVLDRDSKRKISSVVGWKRDERVFGADGKMAATRFPETHYPYIKPLLARTTPSSLPIYPSTPSLINNTLYFPHPSPPLHITPAPASPDAVWSPTALLSHQIAYFRSLAESLASTTAGGGVKEVIKDVIVTVPAWWTQHQRRAYRDALELQGLTCLAMIGEGTAVGLNFAMTRSFPTFDLEKGQGEKEYHVVYDSGALSTTATVLAFYQTSVPAGPKSKTLVNTTHVEVMGTGWAEVGGVNLDVAVQQLLIEDFESKSKKQVKGDKKALAKLAKEAVRVKQILSANQESNVAIESVLDDVDYRSRLSRSALEAAVSDLLPSFSSPLSSALASSGLSIDQITSILLFGGNTRVPLVQAELKSAIESLGGSSGRAADDLIAQNVNTDEAAVLGAAFYGAGLSRQFRMKSVELHEKTTFEYALGVNGKAVRPIFEKGTELGERKAIKLVPEDQSVEVLQDGKPLFAIQFTDVASALANFSTPEPYLNLTFRLDHRGHIAAVNAAIVSDIVPVPAASEEEESGGVAGALKGLFGKKDKNGAEGEATVDGEDVEEKEDGKEEDAKKTKAQKKKEKKEKEKEKNKEPKREKVVVRFRETYPGQKPMGGEEKRNTAARLTSIAAHEQARHAREEARNALEGYLYRLNGLLDPEGENKALKDFATDKERESMLHALFEAFEWLAEHAEVADEKTLRKVRNDIEILEAPVIHRFKQSQSRPKAVEDFQQAMFAARTFFVGASNNQTYADEAHANATAAAIAAGLAEDDMPQPPTHRYTREELKGVGDRLVELEKWMNEKMEKQVMLEADKTADPVVLSEELDERGKALQKMVLDLQNRKPPKAPRVKVKASTTASSSTSSTSASAETASASPAVGGDESAPPRHEEL